jgi:hypothetical protein
MTTILQKLNDDVHYYGETGKQYISSSDIGDLLYDPRSFKRNKEKTPDMVKGSYFHTLVLEPEKASSFTFVSASSRNTNKYKEEAGGDVLLLEKEAEDIREMADAVLSNFVLYDLIHGDTKGYEVPAVGELFGAPFKGKADIVKPSMIVDLKTTSRIDEFKFSAKRYNYDAQAYIYGRLFGAPVTFLVVEKETLRTAVVNCSESFLSSGEQKVITAVNTWARFFGPESSEDINQFINLFTL